MVKIDALLNPNLVKRKSEQVRFNCEKTTSEESESSSSNQHKNKTLVVTSKLGEPKFNFEIMSEYSTTKTLNQTNETEF